MLIKILALITFFVMIAVNALANILPINGVTTGGVSDSYANLFAPAGITFSIWGLIYLLLTVYVIYQFFSKSPETEKLISKINVYFIVSSVANSIWIFSWHYKMIGMTVLLMLILLYSLIRISVITNGQTLALKDKLFIKVPFGIYFGWITVATIANLTAFFVTLGWKNFIFPDLVWTIIILVIGTGIASVTAIKQKNLAYGLVPVWAYLGIYLKHTSPIGFDGQYPLIISTTLLCLGFLGLVNGYLVVKRRSL